MSFPFWFKDVPTFETRDPLAEMLGSAERGLLLYHYADAVRLCGHSCPTVACAWLMATRGLQALWTDELPLRGGVRVAFAENRETGTAGVTAAVFALLSGAADQAGFKGLGGRFDRRLASFGASIPQSVRLTRIDTGAAVDVAADPATIPSAPALTELAGAVIGGTANALQRTEFSDLWQDRVRRILQAGDQVVRLSLIR